VLAEKLNPDNAKRQRYGYLICLVIFLGYVLVFFHRLCPAVIALDMQAAFGASGTLLGVLGSAYFYPYAIMQLPTGVLADSWGPRKTVSVFFLLAALGSVLMGFAPVLSVAIFGRILVGVGVSTLFVCNFKLLAEWFDPRKFVIMGGIFMTMGGVGALSASAPLAWVSNLIGWRMSLVAVGAVTLVMAVFIYGVVRDRPADMGPVSDTTAKKDSRGRKNRLSSGIKLVVGSGRFWPVSIWVFFGTGIAFAHGGLWGGPYLMHVCGLDKLAAGRVLSMFAVALMIGSPFLGWVANRFGRKPVFVSCSLVLITVCAIFYLFTDQLPLSMLYVLFFCLSFAGAAVGPVTATVAKELFPVSIAGTSVGIVNLFPFFGAALFQLVIGIVLSRGGVSESGYALAGYQNMFLIYLMGAVITLLAALLLTETLQTWEPGHEE
jgi:sugar phosphate permease